MLDITQDGHHAYAIIMEEPVNGLIGIMQCAFEECRCYAALVCDHGTWDPKTPEGEACSRAHGQVFYDFIQNHPCPRFKTKPSPINSRD